MEKVETIFICEKETYGIHVSQASNPEDFYGTHWGGILAKSRICISSPCHFPNLLKVPQKNNTCKVTLG